jgi:hypothetical protein
LSATTAVVNVAATDNAIMLSQFGGGSGADVDVTYSVSQVKLTAQAGTQFNVNGTKVSEYTINTSRPKMKHLHFGNRKSAVKVDGTGGHGPAN